MHVHLYFANAITAYDRFRCEGISSAVSHCISYHIVFADYPEENFGMPSSSNTESERYISEWEEMEQSLAQQSQQDRTVGGWSQDFSFPNCAANTNEASMTQQPGGRFSNLTTSTNRKSSAPMEPPPMPWPLLSIKQEEHQPEERNVLGRDLGMGDGPCVRDDEKYSDWAESLNKNYSDSREEQFVSPFVLLPEQSTLSREYSEDRNREYKRVRGPKKRRSSSG